MFLGTKVLELIVIFSKGFEAMVAFAVLEGEAAALESAAFSLFAGTGIGMILVAKS